MNPTQQPQHLRREATHTAEGSAATPVAGECTEAAGDAGKLIPQPVNSQRRD